MAGSDGTGRYRWDPRYRECVKVVALDGRVRELGLVDLFRQADGLRAVSGKTAGEEIAVLEFLLALVYAAGAQPESDDEWESWAKNGQSLSEVADWLASRDGDDWDLFHPTRPLGQNALLAPFLDEHGTGPAQLVIEHAGDYNLFFDHHHLNHPQPLSPAEAFRAMLTQHVYGIYGRARISGKKTLGPTITNLATGRLCGRIKVVALGSTLGETLRLNLTPTQEPGNLNLSWTTGEIERRGFKVKPPPRTVDGFADLHSSLGRSVLLRPAMTPEGVVVDRVLVAAGELLTLDPQLHLQDAVMSETRDGESKPLWPSPTRALWMEAHALYASVAREAKPKGLYRRLIRLPPAEDPAAGPLIELQAVGLITNKTTAVKWVSSYFPYSPGFEKNLQDASWKGSQIAEHVARSLDLAAFAAWQIWYPNPKPSDKAQQLAGFDVRDEHWQATEDPFNILLDETARGYPVGESVAEYASTVAMAARAFLIRRLDSLPSNPRGFRARTEALGRFDRELTGAKAPRELLDLHGGRA
ncbi:hypothetical protein GCM10027589_12910 [Actinocorallia lasiicapitis]